MVDPRDDVERVAFFLDPWLEYWATELDAMPGRSRQESGRYRQAMERARELLATLAPTDRASIRDEAFEEAARTAYRICAETRHVTLGRAAETAIRALSTKEGNSDV